MPESTTLIGVSGRLPSGRCGVLSSGFKGGLASDWESDTEVYNPVSRDLKIAFSYIIIIYFNSIFKTQL